MADDGVSRTGRPEGEQRGVQRESAPGNPAADAVAVTAADLPVACPGPHTPLWSAHPRVYLDVAATGEARCPYCGTAYRLQGGAARAGH
jgi:uncharacterized Zn-finger protein